MCLTLQKSIRLQVELTLYSTGTGAVIGYGLTALREFLDPNENGGKILDPQEIIALTSGKCDT